MNFYPIKFPYIFQRAFPSLVFYKPPKEKKIYLSFDDGPTPEITDWVLHELQKYNAKATFFCIGKNVEKNPDIFGRIISKNHQIGNHTYEHSKGWKTDTKQYIESVLRTESLLKKYLLSNSAKKLFRPPYGRIKLKQIKALKKLNYQIVMWTTVTGDYAASINIEHNIQKILQKIKPGHILVFHDSKKAFPQLKQILPKVLEELDRRSYQFDIL